MQTALPGHFLAFLFVLVTCSACGYKGSLFSWRFAPRHWQLSNVWCCVTLSEALVSKSSLVSHFLNLLWELLTEKHFEVFSRSLLILWEWKSVMRAEWLRCMISFERVQGLFLLKVTFEWVLIFATSSCWSSDRYFLLYLRVTLNVVWVFLSRKAAEAEMTLYFCPYLHRTADVDDTVRIIGYGLTSGSQLYLWCVCKC